MIDDELKWMAGFFDGEGSVSIIKNRVTKNRKYLSYTLDAQVANTERDMVELFFTRFGGSIRLDNMKGRWKPCYKWHISATKAAVFLEAILPFIRSPRNTKRINLALRFQKHQRRGLTRSNQFIKQEHPEKAEYRRQQEWFWERIRELNVRGRVAELPR